MDFSFLSSTALFQGVSPEEIRSLLSCLSGEIRKFPRGHVIFHVGNVTHSLGIVLSGSVSIENDDVWGNRSILDKVQPGQVFAETYACMQEAPLMVSVVAAEGSEVLFLDVRRILQPCCNACDFHSKLIRNMLSISAQKNFNLSRRILHTSSKSIRGRLLSYLSFQAIQHRSREFEIPFNRQQLADYLNVDRSAMSNELSKMQRDGLLLVNRSRFSLIGIDPEDMVP